MVSYFDPVDVGVGPIFLCLGIVFLPDEIFLWGLPGEFGLGDGSLVHHMLVIQTQKLSISITDN